MSNVIQLNNKNEFYDKFPYSVVDKFTNELHKDDRWYIRRIFKEQKDKGGYIIGVFDGSIGSKLARIRAMGNYYVTPKQLIEDDGTDGVLVIDTLVGNGHGGGSKFMEHLIDLAQSNNLLLALSSQNSARSFYERFYFEYIMHPTINIYNMYYYPKGKPQVAEPLSRKHHLPVA